MSDTKWTIETAPQPPYDWDRKALVLTKGWYTHIACSDGDEMMADGLDSCCDRMVFGPFQSEAEADEAGLDLTQDVGPWYCWVEGV